MAKEKDINIIEALKLLEEEKGISQEFLFDRIKKAIATACKNNYGNEDVKIDLNVKTKEIEVYLIKEVVEEVENPDTQIYIKNAQDLRTTAVVGDRIGIKLDTKQFGRVASQTAKSIIRQGIRDCEREQMLDEFKNKQHEIVSCKVDRIDPRTGAISLVMGKATAVLPKNEQVGTENIKEGDFVKVYVLDVKETEKGPKAIISRTHPDLVKRLFESGVPEIFQGVVEIKAVSREAGSRTKLAVFSRNPDVDAVGTCIGPKGARVATIVDELGGEKIDIVEYSEDPAKFISAALSPSTVVSVNIPDENVRACVVTVPDSQLSLAIGNKGQNARLAAKLTGWKIDIKPESGFFGENN